VASPWNLDPALTKDRTALVLFDCLQGYLHPADPAKAAALEAAGLVKNLQRLLEGARAAGFRIFYGAANHSPDGSDSALRLTDTDMDLNPWPQGYVPARRPPLARGDRGIQVADELTPREGEDIVIHKHRWSAFFQTSLELALRARGIDTVILAGLSTDVGVAATAYSARDRDFGLVVVSDACYSSRGNNNQFFMERVFPRMGRVMTTDAALAAMR
jgi:ureidoacrylate peracid hydrolase